ncbi:MAG: CBS domain-containing protein [Pseudohongiella sp.]|nr:CBS domain-containing protein [Pseudohongiella sp.]
MLRSVNLEDYMISKPVTVLADAPLFEAVDLITKNQVSGLCVVNDDGELAGILSEMDCLRGILSASYDDGSIGTVRDYMVCANINSAKASDDIIDVASDMLAKGQRRRPVVNENNKLVGQITCRQILAAVRKLTGTKSPAK